MDDRWRDTYDKWKTQCPDEAADAQTCERHGNWLVRGAEGEWFCEACEHEDAQKCETWEQREAYLAMLNESEAVKKAMRRFWRRLDEENAKRTASEKPQQTSDGDPAF